MQPIEETYLEQAWGDAERARAARDQRVIVLQQQGYECQCQTLYRIDNGQRVFLLIAQTEAIATTPPAAKQTSPRTTRPVRRYERC